MTHRIRRALAALAPILLLGTAAACGDDDLSLRDVEGTYAFVPPALDLAPGFSDTLVIARLALESPATGGVEFRARQRTTVLERRAAAPVGSAPDSLVVHQLEYRVSTRGDLVYFSTICDPASLALCFDGWVYRGPLENGRLTMTPRPEMSVSARAYQRVR